MRLHGSTIKKFFREHFTGSNPIKVTAAERKPLGKKIKQQLTGLNNISTKRHYHYLSHHQKKRFVCEFSLRDPSARYEHYSNNFQLIINEQDELTIKDYYAEAVVSSIDEILSFIATCQERLEEQKAKKSKREKVRKLKAQAIIAQVKKLAREEKFDFFTETDSVKLKLYIKLSEQECAELHIPFKTFQDALPHLRAAILSVRELYGRGIKFKLKSTKNWYIDWMTHDSL